MQSEDAGKASQVSELRTNIEKKADREGNPLIKAGSREGAPLQIELPLLLHLAPDFNHASQSAAT
jgi:hypothetical protein